MSAHGANLFPVFSEQGLEPTDLHGVAVEQDPATQTLRGRDFLTTAPPAMIWRDPAAEQQRMEEAFHFAAMNANPKLSTATAVRDRARAVVKQWTDAVSTLAEAVSNLRNLCARTSVTHEDSVPGGRRARLAVLSEELENARAELAAAHEELAVADGAVDVLVTI